MKAGRWHRWMMTLDRIPPTDGTRTRKVDRVARYLLGKQRSGSACVGSIPTPSASPPSPRYGTRAKEIRGLGRCRSVVGNRSRKPGYRFGRGSTPPPSSRGGLTQSSIGCWFREATTPTCQQVWDRLSFVPMACEVRSLVLARSDHSGQGLGP